MNIFYQAILWLYPAVLAKLRGSTCTCKMYSYWTINVYIMSSGVQQWHPVYEYEWTTLNDFRQTFPHVCMYDDIYMVYCTFGLSLNNNTLL